MIGAPCAHPGCVVAASGDGFACPCHGSQFSRDGRVVIGPAPLAWCEVTLAPDGQMVVDTKKQVASGTKVALG